MIFFHLNQIIHFILATPQTIHGAFRHNILPILATAVYEFHKLLNEKLEKVVKAISEKKKTIKKGKKSKQQLQVLLDV